MAEEQARVLARGTNIAVTQLEGRAFPGIHVQGGTLFALVGQFMDAAGRLRQVASDREALEDLEYAIEETNQILRFYESVLAGRGSDFPILPAAAVNLMSPQQAPGDSSASLSGVQVVYPGAMDDCDWSMTQAKGWIEVRSVGEAARRRSPSTTRPGWLRRCSGP